MTFDKHSLTLFVGQHEFLTLSCQAIIDARYVFLFIRLLRELNALSSQQSAFHVFYIDIDKRTGIPTPSIDVLGIEPPEYRRLCDRYEMLYRQALAPCA